MFRRLWLKIGADVMGRSKPKKSQGRKISPKFSAKKILYIPPTVETLRRLEKFGAQLCQFHWDLYSCLAYQRNQVAEAIQQALLESAQDDFEFKNWQRTVAYRYALKPLSVGGSLANPAGGRFNIGDLNPMQFSPFPVLYIAQDKSTTFQEMLCQDIERGNEEKAFNSALLNPASIVSVSISGFLDSIIDLRSPERLQPFVDVIKNFNIPKHIYDAARELKETVRLIQSVNELKDALLDSDWRRYPMVFDVPSASQIFGQLVAEAGIEGIVYPSKFTGKNCLAVFPQNFSEITDSFIQLDDEPPPEARITRIDANLWNSFKDDLSS